MHPIVDRHAVANDRQPGSLPMDGDAEQPSATKDCRACLDMPVMVPPPGPSKPATAIRCEPAAAEAPRHRAGQRQRHRHCSRPRLALFGFGSVWTYFVPVMPGAKEREARKTAAVAIGDDDAAMPWPNLAGSPLLAEVIKRCLDDFRKFQMNREDSSFLQWVEASYQAVSC